MDIWSITGISASVLVVSSFLPQIIKSLKTKSTKDISAGWPALLFFASILWVLYGIHLNDIIIISVNSVLALFNVFMIILKLKFG